MKTVGYHNSGHGTSLPKEEGRPAIPGVPSARAFSLP